MFALNSRVLQTEVVPARYRAGPFPLSDKPYVAFTCRLGESFYAGASGSMMRIEPFLSRSRSFIGAGGEHVS
jgi:hypothetical protein